MSFGMAYATKKRCAKGGEVSEKGEYDPVEMPKPVDNESANMEDADMIARIMHKRKEYAQGGVVANDVGVAAADEEPAEFDDLVLDDHLEQKEHASDEIGDESVKDDPIDRIMMKRKKK